MSQLKYGQIINCGLTILIVTLFSLCRLRITTQLRSGAVDKMAGIFIKCIWHPCICQPNELKREIKKNTGGAKRGAKKKSGWAIAHPDPPLESPLCVWLLLVAVTLTATSASCERSFSKMKLVKTSPRNSMTSERLGNTDLLLVDKYELKNRFSWFIDGFNSRNDNRRIKLHWGDDDINSNVDYARICVKIYWSLSICLHLLS